MPRDTFETMRSAVVAVALCARVALGQEPGSQPTPTPKPSIQSAIDPAVEKWWRASQDPCRAFPKGVPCFPVEVQAEGPSVSVLDSLYHLDDAKRPEHRPPTVDEMKEARPGSQSASGGVGFDPGCLTNHLAKKLKGHNDTYHVYRVRGPGGSQVVMSDAKLDPTYVQGDIEYLGKFTGECGALSAFRHEDRK